MNMDRPAWLSTDLRVTQASRKVPTFEEAAPGCSFERLGRFYLAIRTDGMFARVDPKRPWSGATVGVYATRADAERKVPGMHPGQYLDDGNA